MTIQVLAAADHAVMCVGIAAMIANDSGIEIIAEATDGNKAVALSAAHRPSVVLMDLRMPKLDGWGQSRLARVIGRADGTGRVPS